MKPMESEDCVCLRDCKERMGVMDDKLVALEKNIESRFNAERESRQALASSMEKRLEGMNEFRSSMQDMQKLFATREEVSRLDEAQKPFVTRTEMISFCAARVEFRFTENGNFPLTFPVFEAVDGLDTAGGVRPLFPFQPDWSKRPNSGASEQDVDRRCFSRSVGTQQAQDLALCQREREVVQRPDLRIVFAQPFRGYRGGIF